MLVLRGTTVLLVNRVIELSLYYFSSTLLYRLNSITLFTSKTVVPRSTSILQYWTYCSYVKCHNNSLVDTEFRFNSFNKMTPLNKCNRHGYPISDYYQQRLLIAWSRAIDNMALAWRLVPVQRSCYQHIEPVVALWQFPVSFLWSCHSYVFISLVFDHLIICPRITSIHLGPLIFLILINDLTGRYNIHYGW